MSNIRRAVPGDHEQLTQIALASKQHWGYPPHWVEVWTPQLTFAPEYFDENESWVAEAGGVPIAFCTIQEKNGLAWLENLWVLPEYIGKGIGKELFLHAVDLACTWGLEKLQLEADPNAVGFYEKMGMRQVGERYSEVDRQPRILPIMEMKL